MKARSTTNISNTYTIDENRSKQDGYRIVHVLYRAGDAISPPRDEQLDILFSDGHAGRITRDKGEYSFSPGLAERLQNVDDNDIEAIMLAFNTPEYLGPEKLLAHALTQSGPK